MGVSTLATFSIPSEAEGPAFLLAAGTPNPSTPSAHSRGSEKNR